MKKVELSYGPWKAKISLDYGFNVYSLTYNDDDVLRTPEDPDENFKATPMVFGTPMLLPPDRLTNNGFPFEGKQYTMTHPYPDKPYRIHGSMHSAPMKLVYQSKSMAIGEYENKGERFPFPFKLTVTCELSDQGLHQRFSILNTGDGNMPLVFGVHTMFYARPIVSISLGKAWETGENFEAIKEIPLTEQDRQIVSGRNTEGLDLHNIYTDSGFNKATIGEYSYRRSANFKNWVVWNKGGDKGFISIQPQSAPVNALNHPGEYIVLASGQEEVFETMISREI